MLLAVALNTGFAIHSMLKLEQKFDLKQFVPESSYLKQFNEKQGIYFPVIGIDTGIYLGHLNYTESLPNLLNMSKTLTNRPDLMLDYDSWIDGFAEFAVIYHNTNITDVAESDWNIYLNEFLSSWDGGKYRQKIHFDTPLKCGEPAPPIKVSLLSFNFRPMTIRSEYIPVKEAIEKIVHDANLTTGEGFSTVWSKSFGNWGTNEVVYAEVSTNLLLAVVCVMSCTLIFIMNINVCFWILVYLILTMIAVGGYMQLSGLTLEMITCMCLQLAIGLCIDYATHIGHTFLTITEGTKDERALEAVLQIGAAVFHGGFSTLLSISVLAGSESYVILAFLKVSSTFEKLIFTFI